MFPPPHSAMFKPLRSRYVLSEQSLFFTLLCAVWEHRVRVVCCDELLHGRQLVG